MSTSTSPAQQSSQKDWSATQYLKFHNERTRPVHDLISRAAPHVMTSNANDTPRIYDLGCGPGNSTTALLSAFPKAHITGVDSSPDMLSKARLALPDVDFVHGDISTFTPAHTNNDAPDLLFSNAAFHWLRCPTRIPTLTTLFSALPPGGVLAIQVPDNYDEPSHTLMRTTASLPSAPWSPSFSTTRIGDLSDLTRPDLDPIEPPETWYNALIPHARSVDIWRTEYMHVLESAGAIVEWVKGTGLQPYLQRIEGEEERRAFLKEYERRLEGVYGRLWDGKVLLGYPRLFVVAVRK